MDLGDRFRDKDRFREKKAVLPADASRRMCSKVHEVQKVQEVQEASITRSIARGGCSAAGAGAKNAHCPTQRDGQIEGLKHVKSDE